MKTIEKKITAGRSLERTTSRRSTPVALAFLAGAAFAASIACAQDFSKVEVQATKLTDSVYMLTGAGGNLGVSVGED